MMFAKHITPLWRFLGSMRLAVFLLCVLGIASAIGTLLVQNQPVLAYIDQFGEYWAKWFIYLGLDNVYNQLWFVGIMALVLLSTSICLTRNAPKMLRDMRTLKNHDRTSSLLHLPKHHQLHTAIAPNDLATQYAKKLELLGYRFKAATKGVLVDGHEQQAFFITGKRGRINRLGYICTHMAILVICLGGFLDSDLATQAQVKFLGKEPQPNATLFNDMPYAARLNENTLSYRGFIKLAPDQAVDFVSLPYSPTSYLLQKLPFELRLDHFQIEYYPTGMPKQFASDVSVRDPKTGELSQHTIEVNKPLRMNGVAVYQSDFDDGGTQFDLKIHPLAGSVSQPLSIAASMLEDKTIDFGPRAYNIRWQAFKPTNVEQQKSIDAADGDPAQELLSDKWKSAQTTAGTSEKEFVNLGSMVEFEMKDENGQVQSFRNYLSPVLLKGVPVFLSGVKKETESDYQFLHIPADENQTVTGFMDLRATLSDASMREKASLRFAKQLATQDKPEYALYQQSSQQLLNLFATGGYDAVISFIKQRTAADQNDAAQSDQKIQGALKLLNSTFWELAQVSREAHQQPQMAEDEASLQFLRLAMDALSGLHAYDAPFYLQVEGFELKQASIFQVTRSPGAWWVYFGCILLALGTVLQMFIRESRLWIHIIPQRGAQQVTFGVSSTRRHQDFERHWAAVQKQLTDIES